MIDVALRPRPRLCIRRTRRPILALSLAGVMIVATLATNPLHPVVLFNATRSEPTGLYAANLAPVRVGELVAFKAPAAAFPYADRKLGYLRHTLMLKGVAAGHGDRVCAATNRLVINGQDRAPIAAADGEGRALPRWLGCRQLSPGELFVFSERVPNSFDSRYFGPVSRAAVVGVYQPLLVDERRA